MKMTWLSVVRQIPGAPTSEQLTYITAWDISFLHDLMPRGEKYNEHE